MESTTAPTATDDGRPARPAWLVIPEGYLLASEVTAKYLIPNQTLTNWRHRNRGPEWDKLLGEKGRPGGIVIYPEAGVVAFLRGKGLPAAPDAAEPAT